MAQPLLEIRDLHAGVEGVEILRGINLTVNPGEVHAIMGLNGSGKSTLASVLAGREEYEISRGEVLFQGKDLLDLSPDERANEGLFLAFQYPVEIPGVANMTFLRAALDAKRKYLELPPMPAKEFIALTNSKLDTVKFSRDFLKRSINEGFSGGEKKRFEIFQMALLEPTLAILDETDSGLDVDALKIAAEGVNALRSPERGFVVITHYQRLLDYIVPDIVHVMIDGRIVKQGGKELAKEMDVRGYDWLKQEAAANSGS
jgi:Fe-S cluster assembly ATP-binding protein